MFFNFLRTEESVFKNELEKEINKLFFDFNKLNTYNEYILKYFGEKDFCSKEDFILNDLKIDIEIKDSLDPVFVRNTIEENIKSFLNNNDVETKVNVNTKIITFNRGNTIIKSFKASILKFIHVYGNDIDIYLPIKNCIFIGRNKLGNGIQKSDGYIYLGLELSNHITKINPDNNSYAISISKDEIIDIKNESIIRNNNILNIENKYVLEII